MALRINAENFEEKVLKEDVENGIYEEYPIIKYNKK